MSVTITVSDKTFQRLYKSAKARGKGNVEQLLEEWPDEPDVDWEKELARRKTLGEQMRELRERIYRKHGLMSDSTDLIREDRER